MSLLIILFAVGGTACWAWLKYADVAQAQTRALALQIAGEEGLQNDFMFVWKRFALVLDRGRKDVLLCDRAGSWEFIARPGCEWTIDVGSEGKALRIITRDIDDEASYLFKGTEAEIQELERKLNAVLQA